MNIKDFLIDNYIYIIIVIVLIIITIIGFLADKKKGDKKKEEPPQAPLPNMNQQVMPMNTPTFENTPQSMTNLSQGEQMVNQVNQGLNQMPTQQVNQNASREVINNAPFFNTNMEPNNVTMQQVPINQNINSQGTIPSDTSNMFNQNAGNMYQTNGPVPIPNNNINNQVVTPIPQAPMPNTIPTPIPGTPAMPNNGSINQNNIPTPNPIPQQVNQAPIGFVYGQNPNNNQM